MPEQWVAQLLGPLGLLAGSLCALWLFYTERIVAGKTLQRQRDQNADLLQQNRELLRQNEALQRRLDRAVTVSSRAIDHAEKAGPT